MNMPINLRFTRVTPGAQLPVAPHNDIIALFDCIIRPVDYLALSTGLSCDVPEGHVLKIIPRRVLAEKYQVVAMPGIIHPGRNSEIFVILNNLSVVPYKVCQGDSIAQLILVPVVSFDASWIGQSEQLQAAEMSTAQLHG